MAETEPSCQPGPCDLLVPVDQVLPVTKLEQPPAPYSKRIHDWHKDGYKYWHLKHRMSVIVRLSFEISMRDKNSHGAEYVDYGHLGCDAM